MWPMLQCFREKWIGHAQNDWHSALLTLSEFLEFAIVNGEIRSRFGRIRQRRYQTGENSKNRLLVNRFEFFENETMKIT